MSEVEAHKHNQLCVVKEIIHGIKDVAEDLVDGVKEVVQDIKDKKPIGDIVEDVKDCAKEIQKDVEEHVVHYKNDINTPVE